MLESMRRVRRMLEHGVPFERIEAHIADAGLCEEEEAVLWLFAWVGGEPSTLALDLGKCPRPVVVPSHTSVGLRGMEPVEGAGHEPLIAE